MVSYKALNTPAKCTFTYASNTIRDSNATQRSATIKCPIPNARNTIRNNYICQRSAIPKCPCPNARNIIRNDIWCNVFVSKRDNCTFVFVKQTPSSKIKFGDKHFTSPFHLQKRLPLMLTTLSGRTRFFNELQSANAPFPMLVTPSGITRLLKEEQPQNELFLMLVTQSGRTRLVKEEQYWYLLLVDYQYYTL